LGEEGVAAGGELHVRREGIPKKKTMDLINVVIRGVQDVHDGAKRPLGAAGRRVEACR
jgi:hypothetical protein